MERAAKGKRPRAEDAEASASRCVEEDEEQMEQFFALLKGVREMREQWRMAGGGESAKRQKTEGPSWTPTFQWEDFAGAAAVDLTKGAAVVPAPSELVGQGRNERKEEENNLDLRLAL